MFEFNSEWQQIELRIEQKNVRTEKFSFHKIYMQRCMLLNNNVTWSTFLILKLKCP